MDEILEVDERGGVSSNLPDRKLILQAAEILLHQLGVDHRCAMQVLSALRLGFAIGTADDPEKFVPVVVLDAARVAAEEAKKYRERERAGLDEMNVTRAMGLGQFPGVAPGGLW